MTADGIPALGAAEALTAFHVGDRDGLIQVVDPDASIDIRRLDLPQVPANGPDEPFESFLLADRRERFDLTRTPTVRLTVVRRVGLGAEADPPAYRAVLTFHHALLDGRSLRLLIMADHAAALRPWLVPRRMPFVGLDGMLLRLPLAPSVSLTPGEAAVLRACDGIRDANEVAAVVLADRSAGFGGIAEVFALMARLADSRRLAWRVDVALQDTRPEQSMRAVLARVTDDGIREPAEKALDELTAAKDDLAQASGDPDRVAAAMAGLEATFTRLTGVPPTRRAGELYAGRTVAYEECLRGGTVRLGADAFDGVREAMGLVLDSARWFTTSIGALYAQHFDEVYRERAAALGTDAVPFADFWLLIGESLFEQPPKILDPAVEALTQRWAAVLDPPPGARRVHLRAADLRERAAEAFPEARRNSTVPEARRNSTVPEARRNSTASNRQEG